MAVGDHGSMRANGAKRGVPSAGLLSVAGLVAGLAVASCCLVPFVLFLLGISGAWIGSLTGLEPYRFYFTGFAVACIGLGFRRVYRSVAIPCAGGSYCAQPASGRIAKIGLWSATAVVLIAIVAPYLIVHWF